jgi:hypothetical protein
MSVVMMERKQEPENWNDDRLDDLNRKVDEGFRDMREEFRAMRGENAADRRTLIQAAAALWITSMVGFLGVIATVLATV